MRLALKNLLVKRETRELLKPYYYVDRKYCKLMGLPLPEKDPDTLFWEAEKKSREGLSMNIEF